MPCGFTDETAVHCTESNTSSVYIACDDVILKLNSLRSGAQICPDIVKCVLVSWFPVTLSVGYQCIYQSDLNAFSVSSVLAVLGMWRIVQCSAQRWEQHCLSSVMFAPVDLQIKILTPLCNPGGITELAGPNWVWGRDRRTKMTWSQSRIKISSEYHAACCYQGT